MNYIVELEHHHVAFILEAIKKLGEDPARQDEMLQVWRSLAYQTSCQAPPIITQGKQVAV